MLQPLHHNIFFIAAQVLTADSQALAAQLPERCAALLASLAGGGSPWSHLWAPATTGGKNLLPRAAALLGVQPVADVIQVVDADTFVRPTYAGNAIATVKYNVPGLRMMSVGGGQNILPTPAPHRYRTCWFRGVAQ